MVPVLAVACVAGAWLEAQWADAVDGVEVAELCNFWNETWWHRFRPFGVSGASGEFVLASLDALFHLCAE